MFAILLMSNTCEHTGKKTIKRDGKEVIVKNDELAYYTSGVDDGSSGDTLIIFSDVLEIKMADGKSSLEHTFMFFSDGRNITHTIHSPECPLCSDYRQRVLKSSEQASATLENEPTNSDSGIDEDWYENL